MSAKLTKAELQNLAILGALEHNGMHGFGPGTGIHRGCLRALAAKGLAIEGPFEPKIRWARITHTGRAFLRALPSPVHPQEG